MAGVFLDASILESKYEDERERLDIQKNKILFDFPNGFETLRLIEECRALNALDVSVPENFDLMYDITMQMLTGKPVFIYFVEDKKKKEIGRFVVTNRYQNLRGVGIIDEYPVIVNWLVEFVAGFLGKKLPRSLKEVLGRMSEREELMKKNPETTETVTTSFLI